MHPDKAERDIGFAGLRRRGYQGSDSLGVDRFTSVRSSANSVGDRFSSVAATWRIVAVAPWASSPLTCMTLLFVGDRFTSTVTEQVCVCLLPLDRSLHCRCASLWHQWNPLRAVGLATEARFCMGFNGGKAGLGRTPARRIEKHR